MRNFIPLCQKFMMLLGFGVLLNACGNDGPSYYSSDETFSSETETGSSSSVGISSSTPVVVSCSSSSSEELYSSSMDIEISSSSEISPSSSYVQKSKVLKDSSIYYPEENRLLDLRDSQEYRTVVIGAQTWMAENLNYAYLEPGYDQDSTSFCYNNDSEKCKKFGRLYMFSAAVDGVGIFDGKIKGCSYSSDSCEYQESLRGICPLGFHLPSKLEVEDLVEFVGGLEQAGKALKSTSGWLDIGCNDPASSSIPESFDCSDDYGFCVKPSGYICRFYAVAIGRASGNESVANYSACEYGSAYFWTSSAPCSSATCSSARCKSHPYLFFFYAGNDYMSQEIAGRIGDEAYSIRCIKD